jgi:hypothetical protein
VTRRPCTWRIPVPLALPCAHNRRGQIAHGACVVCPEPGHRQAPHPLRRCGGLARAPPLGRLSPFSLRRGSLLARANPLGQPQVFLESLCDARLLRSQLLAAADAFAPRRLLGLAADRGRSSSHFFMQIHRHFAPFSSRVPLAPAAGSSPPPPPPPPPHRPLVADRGVLARCAALWLDELPQDLGGRVSSPRSSLAQSGHPSVDLRGRLPARLALEGGGLSVAHLDRGSIYGHQHHPCSSKRAVGTKPRLGRSLRFSHLYGGPWLSQSARTPLSSSQSLGPRPLARSCLVASSSLLGQTPRLHGYSGLLHRRDPTGPLALAQSVRLSGRVPPSQHAPSRATERSCLVDRTAKSKFFCKVNFFLSWRARASAASSSRPYASRSSGPALGTSAWCPRRTRGTA